MPKSTNAIKIDFFPFSLKLYWLLSDFSIKINIQKAIDSGYRTNERTVKPNC